MGRIDAIFRLITGMGRFSFDVDGKTDMTGGPIDEPPQKTGTVQDKAAGALKNRKIQGLTTKKAGFFTDGEGQFQCADGDSLKKGYDVHRPG